MHCSSCRVRPGRRACPALESRICPVCCGTKRQTEIRCPETCVYLASSRSHPPASVRRQQEHDMATIVPGMMGLTDGQQRLLFLGLTLIHRFRGEGLETARDIDVADAAGSLASAYETESKGLIYEPRAGSLPAQKMAAGIRTVFDELGRDRPSAFVRDAALVLRRIEQLARGAEKLAPGDPVSFLSLVGRVSSRIGPVSTAPESTAAAGSPEPEPGPAIILP